ncbi:MAG TPA: Arm DNA-binding domain-containing protein, partial [Terriglobales bacterium]|nr:Arm DNA-binding domain-containing protein [Terriglobales bacterium]
MNITESAIKKLRPPKVGSVIYYDTDHQEKIPGFGVRLTAQGAVSFVLNYCVNGRERRCTIGRWPECSASR